MVSVAGTCFEMEAEELLRLSWLQRDSETFALCRTESSDSMLQVVSPELCG
jgi:hypothetical protein